MNGSGLLNSALTHLEKAQRTLYGMEPVVDSFALTGKLKRRKSGEPILWAVI